MKKYITIAALLAAGTALSGAAVQTATWTGGAGTHTVEQASAASNWNNQTLTWNSTGEVCKEWTLQDLSALAFAIDARVTSLVTYQQTKEVEMRNAESMEELNAIVIDYDSMK